MISGVGLFAVIMVIALAQFQVVVAQPYITSTSGLGCTQQNSRAVGCPLNFGQLTVSGTYLYVYCTVGTPSPIPVVTLVRSGSQPVLPTSSPVCQDVGGTQSISFGYPALVSGIYDLNYTTGLRQATFSAALTTVGVSADPTISSVTGCSNNNIDGSTSYCLTGLSIVTIAGTGFYCGQTGSTSKLQFQVGNSATFNAASTSLTIPNNKTYISSDIKATFTIPSTSDWLKTGKSQPDDGTQMYIRANCPPLTTWSVGRSAYTTGLDPAILSFFQQFYTAIVTAIVLFVVLCVVVPIGVCIFCCAGCCATAATAGAIIGRRNQPKTSGLIYSNEMPQTAYVNMR